MTRIAKIALINSEIDLVLLALDDHIDSYDDEGQTVKRDILMRSKEKINKALRKFDDNNKQVIHDVTKFKP